MRLALLIASAALIAAPVAAAAQTVIPLQKFESVELNGGGSVVIRQAPVQRVTLRKGSTEFTSLEVSDRGRLVIHACNRHCPHHYDLEIEIETPSVTGAAVNGGGLIEASAPFRPQSAISAAVRGGGKVDVRAVPASAVSASVQGGGVVLVLAQTSLSAAVSGGGAIHYAGQPSLSTAVHGGGSVSPIH